MSYVDKLTPKQKALADLILADPDIQQREAAVKAGFSEHSADTQASQVLKMPKVQAYMDAQNAARARRTRVTHDRVLREIASLAFSNIKDYVIDDAGEIHLRDGANRRAMKAV